MAEGAEAQGRQCFASGRGAAVSNLRAAERLNKAWPATSDERCQCRADWSGSRNERQGMHTLNMAILYQSLPVKGDEKLSNNWKMKES